MPQETLRHNPLERRNFGAEVSALMKKRLPATTYVTFAIHCSRRVLGSPRFRHWFRLDRQLDGEGRALADKALDANAPLMLLDDLAAHAQAETGAAVAVLVRLLGGVKRLEDQPQALRRYADAGIRDAHLGHLR